MSHIIVIGAGLVGCASAWRLAQRGFTVTLLERSGVGEEAASVAAAGMLSAQIDAHPIPAMQALCLASRDQYAAFVHELTELTGVLVELRPAGALSVAYGERRRGVLAELVAEQVAAGLQARMLTPRETAAIAPLLSPVIGAAHFVREAVVEPRTLLEATRRAAERAGVRLSTGAAVHALSFDAEGEVDGVVTTAHERLSADLVVVAAGSWSTRIEGISRLGLAPTAVEPVRGQMIELELDEPWLGPTVDGPVAYLSPREDGRMLVGSTVERVGYERAVTAGAVARLLTEAIRMVPSLESARLKETWCGFRAATRDQLPILDRVGKVVLATGHYRNGIVLAPITADVVVALAAGEAPPLDITPFGLARLVEARPSAQQEERHGHVS